ncbi:fibroblast growth factor receptor 3-like [Planococcus citri]|uniref:fibroblast growth factor receptor 3-like n=1 Tax=Planococcus citri TaxID=170843 RepID=UPI0031FA0738
MKNSAIFFIIFISLLWSNVESGGRYPKQKLQNCPDNEVQCAPKFKMNMAPFAKFDKLQEKDSQNFKCLAYGDPAPNITWYKNGENLNKSVKEFEWTAYNLQAKKDDGNYTCEVCNSMGCIKHTFEVHVIRHLKIVDGPKNATRKIGERYELRCQHNHPLDEYLRIDWFYATTDPFNSTGPPNDDQSERRQNNHDRDVFTSTREIEIESENQTGWYTCGVITKPEQVYKSAFLTVKPKDNVDEHPSVLLSFSGSIVLALLLAVVILIAYHKFRENNPIPPTIMRQYIPAIVIKKQATSESGSNELKSTFDVFVERRPAPDNFNVEEGHQYYEFPKDAEWEFPREKVQLLNGIGEGNFGKVFKAEAFEILKPGISTTVAVKTLKQGFDDEAAKNLVVETETMKAIGKHKNIINLLGCCTDNGSLMVIMEYAALGNLVDFLRTHSYPVNNNGNDYVTLGNNLSEETLLGFSLQIAEAMEFLASKKCIHRDLAARNVLVTEDHTMKVADFGLARNVHENDYYRNTTNAHLPIKWMAPESLYHRKYTSQSDVWSFGIVLWELGSMGTPPYRDLSNSEVLKGLPDGLRMDKPELFSVETYKLMRNCWSYLPEERPTFASIVQQLTNLIDDIKQQNQVPENFEMDLSSESEEEYVESSLYSYDVPLVGVQVC